MRNWDGMRRSAQKWIETGKNCVVISILWKDYHSPGLALRQRARIWIWTYFVMSVCKLCMYRLLFKFHLIQWNPTYFWSKARLAPAKGRTLPCLELLTVYLTLKCLLEVFSCFSKVKFQSLNIFSDSLITLAWISNKGLKNKQIFVRNRIQDIGKMTSALIKEHSLRPRFRHVRSEGNSADLFTRGLSTKEFSFWLHGPKWLEYNLPYWPMFK